MTIRIAPKPCGADLYIDPLFSLLSNPIAPRCVLCSGGQNLLEWVLHAVLQKVLVH